MRFYYNADMNICAEETWVTDYLFMGGVVESREEALEELRTKHEVYGLSVKYRTLLRKSFVIKRRIKWKKFILVLLKQG